MRLLPMVGGLPEGEKEHGGRGETTRKFLITWTLILDRGELDEITAHPQSLDHGLNYVKSMMKESGLQLYRIIPMEELTHYSREVPSSARPTGIAIADARSLEEARMMVENWVDGLSYGKGTVPIRSYLEYDIKPLMDLGQGGRR
jgi:hypothetical protein